MDNGQGECECLRKCVSVCLLFVNKWDKGKEGAYVCNEDRERSIWFPIVIGAQSEVPSCRKQSAWHMSAQSEHKHTHKLIEKHTNTHVRSVAPWARSHFGDHLEKPKKKLRKAVRMFESRGPGVTRLVGWQVWHTQICWPHIAPVISSRLRTHSQRFTSTPGL